MANVWDTLGSLGMGVIEYAGAYVGGASADIRNQSEADSALAERLKINNQIALQDAAQKAEQSKNTSKIVENLAYILAGLVAILVIVWAFKMFKK
jgi:hypothetical protein